MRFLRSSIFNFLLYTEYIWSIGLPGGGEVRKIKEGLDVRRMRREEWTRGEGEERSGREEKEKRG